MPVHLIRHACAGDKHTWVGRDADRPLDPAGIRQAEVLASHLAAVPIHRILTSPAHRCVQTVEPLAQSHGLTIEPLPELGPDSSAAALLNLVPALDASTAVACTHGELMRPLLAMLRVAGTKIVSLYDDDEWLLGKGTAWTLTVDPTGTIVALEHVAPDGLPTCPEHDRAGV